jgi:hypothetical protein
MGGGDPFLKKRSPTGGGGDGVKIGKLQRKKTKRQMNYILIATVSRKNSPTVKSGNWKLFAV